jgi:hypothetical protein
MIKFTTKPTVDDIASVKEILSHVSSGLAGNFTNVIIDRASVRTSVAAMCVVVAEAAAVYLKSLSVKPSEEEMAFVYEGLSSTAGILNASHNEEQIYSYVKNTFDDAKAITAAMAAREAQYSALPA